MTRKRPRKIIITRDSDIDMDAQKFNAAVIIILSIVLNLILFFNYAYQTLIPTTLTICIYLLFPVALFIVLKLKKIQKPELKSFTITPLLLNTILIINYYISFDPTQETYFYQKNSQMVFSRIGYRSYNQNSTEITLQNNAYDKCYGIRVFLSEENIKGGYKITYTFKTGVFGLRVMTDYSFS
jgi:hypothetical protein